MIGSGPMCVVFMSKITLSWFVGICKNAGAKMLIIAGHFDVDPEERDEAPLVTWFRDYAQRR